MFILHEWWREILMAGSFFANLCRRSHLISRRVDGNCETQRVSFDVAVDSDNSYRSSADLSGGSRAAHRTVNIISIDPVGH